MSVVENSVIGRWVLALCALLYRWYDGSLLAAGLRRFGRGCRAAWMGSAFGRSCRNSAGLKWLSREGALSRAWPNSLLCRGLTTLISLPTIILQAIYRPLRSVVEGSVFARLFLGMAEQTPLLVGWVMLAVMVVPYEAWNNAYSLAGFALCLFLTVFAGVRKPDFRLSLASVGPWLMAFAGMVVLAWYLSIDRSESTRHLSFHLTCMLCVLVLVTTLERREQLVRLLEMASLAMLVISLYGFWQRIQGIEVNPSYVDLTVNRGMPGRVFSFFENPNACGEVLLLLLPLAFALILCGGWGGRLLGLLSFGAGGMAIAMTYSRASWIGLVVAAFLFVLLWNKRIIPVALIVAVIGCFFLPSTVTNRFLTIFNTSDTSTASRFPYYQAAWDFIKTQPFLGAGLGTEQVRTVIEDRDLFHGVDVFVHCHNTYLQIWCEMGFFGLVTFVAGLLWTIRRGIDSVRTALCSSQTRIAVIGGTSALLGAMVCGLADYLWNYPRVMLIFWFVASVALAGIRLAAREANGETA